ncbi:MAG: hypothetical protein A2048_01280 [Deltaproteobacteria bacterium GWA2_45_12]|nr:MAG: hypothetical protein A2048_01280 [Deltaproteobacteria bacterium GWA2_45_12]
MWVEAMQNIMSNGSRLKKRILGSILNAKTPILKALGIPSKQQLAGYERRVQQLARRINSLGRRLRR